MILLRLIGWPYLRRHVLRTALTTGGIVLGTAVFVGMHTANEAVLTAFGQTIDRIAGKTDLQITAGDTGFGEDVLETVQSAATVDVAVPVIEAIVESHSRSQGSLLVLAVDMTGDRSLRDYDFEAEDAGADPLIFLAQPDSLIVTQQLAERNQVAIGDGLVLTTAEGDKRFTVRGIIEPTGLATAFGGNLAIMDVYAAQKMLGRGRTFDRVDVGVKPGTSLADAERELSTLLGAGFQVQPPVTRGRQAEALLRGYSTMVNISSVFALFVGMFIIYNSFATAVAQRRSEIGILRALGATRRQIGLLFLQESLALGAIGAVIGVAVGVSIARAVAASIVAMTAAVYGVGEEAPSVVVTPIVVGTGLLLGLATSVVAAVIPAWQAAHVDPVHAMRKAANEMAARSRRLPVVAGTLAGVAGICLAFGSLRPLFYASYVLIIVALLIMSTTLSGTLARVIRPLLRWIRPVEGALAADSLLQAPRRTAMTVSGLMLSLALVVAFSGMALASYSSIVQWINTTLNPDLFVMPSPRVELRTRRFPAAMAEEIASVQGVRHVQMFRSGRITFRDNPALIVGLEMSKVATTSHTAPVAGEAATMYVRSAAGEGLLVSDSLAQLHGLTLGEVLSIPAPYGTIRLPIVGIVIDYTDQQGSIFIDRSVFVRNWQDDSVSDFRVYLHPGARSSDVQQQIVGQYAGRQQVFVLTNQEVRDYVLQLANQWFGLMDVQIAVAVFVAILGIINTLTVSITDRRRELGVLQAVGAVRAQIRRTIWLEAIAIGAIGLALGAAVGALNLYYILEMVRLDVIGLRLDYSYPLGTLLLLVPIILGAAFIAAIWPAESVLRGSLVEALEYE